MQGNAGDMKYLAVFYDMMRKYQAVSYTHLDQTAGKIGTQRKK